MKMYAAFLNTNTVEDYEIEEGRHLDPELQASLLYRSLWGVGASRDEAINEAVGHLFDTGVIEVFTCDSCVQEVIRKASSKQDALRHLWIRDSGHHTGPRLYALVHHDTLVDFCSRHNLSAAAKLELETFFDTNVFIRPNEQP